MVLFQGAGTDEMGEYMEYSVSLAPINELKSYEIYLNNEVEIYEDSIDDLLDDGGPVAIANTAISVYDVIKAILYEISFYGTPKEKEKVRKDIIKNHKDEDMIPFLNARILKSC